MQLEHGSDDPVSGPDRCCPCDDASWCRHDAEPADSAQHHIDDGNQGRCRQPAERSWLERSSRRLRVVDTRPSDLGPGPARAPVLLYAGMSSDLEVRVLCGGLLLDFLVMDRLLKCHAARPLIA